MVVEFFSFACMIEFPSTTEGSKVRKFLTDFIYYLRIFRPMPLKLRVRTAWRNAGMTL